MMDNLHYYNRMRSVPKEACKPINAGRLKGMTDINPMWRIKTMTETFGPIGIGWYYTIDKQWSEEGSGGEKKVFCNISLYYLTESGEWSKPIPGTGGSSLVDNETKGPYTSDECYKMALTDALSVACKALGMAADIYYANDRTKYTGENVDENTMPVNPSAPSVNPTQTYLCSECGNPIMPTEKSSAVKIAQRSLAAFGRCLCFSCGAKAQEAKEMMQGTKDEQETA